ncbi:LOW QUALITY PROTEIN: Gag protein, partial [Phytophthora palmivora]
HASSKQSARVTRSHFIALVVNPRLRGQIDYLNPLRLLQLKIDREEFPHLTDAQFESIKKMVGIVGGDALRSLVAASVAEQVELVEAFDTYERGLIAQVKGLQAPAAELKPTQPKSLRLMVNHYEGEEGENLHFWVRKVELAMNTTLISTEQLRVAFALSNLGGRAETWAYTCEATSPGCFTTWARRCEQITATFLPANYENRQRSHFLGCKQEKLELYEYIQEMWVLTAFLVRNSLPEHIKGTVFVDGSILHAVVPRYSNTMEEAILW